MAVLSTDLDGALQRRRQRRDQGRPALPRPPNGQIRKEEVAVLPRFFFFCFFFAAEMAGIDFRTSFTQLLFSCYHFVRIFQNGIQVFD